MEKTKKKVAKAKKAKKKMLKPTKKSARKVTAKKPVVKVTITKKVLGKAPEECSFYLSDGRKLQSVYELIDELETMTEDSFREYVNEFGNHFANWMAHVFDENHLAEEMRKIQNRMDTQRLLLKHLVKELIGEKAKTK